MSFMRVWRLCVVCEQQEMEGHSCVWRSTFLCAFLVQGSTT